MSLRNFHPQPPVLLRDQLLQYSPTFLHPSAPRRPDGQIAWFTYEHNAHLEDLLELPSGTVLAIYQAHLVEAAQRVLGENGGDEPPPYEGGGGGGGGSGGGRSQAGVVLGVGSGVLSGIGDAETDGRGAGPHNAERGSLRLRNYDAQSAPTTREVPGSEDLRRSIWASPESVDLDDSSSGSDDSFCECPLRYRKYCIRRHLGEDTSPTRRGPLRVRNPDPPVVVGSLQRSGAIRVRSRRNSVPGVDVVMREAATPATTATASRANRRRATLNDIIATHASGVVRTSPNRPSPSRSSPNRSSPNSNRASPSRSSNRSSLTRLSPNRSSPTRSNPSPRSNRSSPRSNRSSPRNSATATGGGGLAPRFPAGVPRRRPVPTPPRRRITWAADVHGGEAGNISTRTRSSLRSPPRPVSASASSGPRSGPRPTSAAADRSDVRYSGAEPNYYW